MNRRARVVNHFFAGPNTAIEFQNGGREGAAFRHAVAHEVEVGIVEAGLRREQFVFDYRVNEFGVDITAKTPRRPRRVRGCQACCILCIIFLFLLAFLSSWRLFLRQYLTELLRQVWVAISLMQDAAQRLFAALFGRSQPSGQRLGLFESEIGQVNAMADVERGARGVFDQVGRAGDAEQYEAHAVVFRFGCASVVTGADGGEEIVGEGQLDGRVNLVNEDDYAPGGFGQRYVAEEFGQALKRGQVFTRAPPVVEIRFEA